CARQGTTVAYAMDYW
nr:immunoglobulin heavy chain junction region [Mus musculus]MBK4185069.1 immunoglobulin heavy chain junction region [Mus musculus]MBK4185070.1 immunoglobulin heavy chain junction region [Mus musculus]